MNLKESIILSKDMIIIKPLTEKTIQGVVDCEKASVDKWYAYTSLRDKEESTYEELTPEQRWFHGGPTMDQTLLEKHWAESKRDIFDAYEVYVALEKNEVVGFIGALFGEDFTTGKHAYIDLLLVHPKHRRKGIAKKLVHHIEDIAKTRDCECIIVYPEELEGPSGKFYLSLDYEIWEKRCSIQLETKNIPNLEQHLTPASEKREKYWELFFGWHSTSPKAWLMLHSNFAEGIFKVKKPLFHYLAENEPDVIVGGIRWHKFFEFGTAYLWFTNRREDIPYTLTQKHLEVIQHIGYSIGLKRVNLVFLEDKLYALEKLEIAEKPESLEPLLRKKIK